MNRLQEVSPSPSIALPFFGDINRGIAVKRLDQLVEGSLLALLIVLPIAHVTAVRSFLIVAVALFWTARMAVSGDWRIRTPIDLPVLFYAGAVVISVFFAVYPAQSLKEMKGELLTYLIIFYAAAYTMRSGEQVRRLALVLCAWIVVFGLIGVGRFYIEGGQLNSLAVRLTSLARGCTNYADYIALIFPLATWASFRLKGKYAWIAGMATVVALITLYLTHSRAGWVAVALEILLITYFMLRQRALAVALIAVLAVVVWLLPQNVLSHGVKDRLRYDTPEQAMRNGSESVRMYQWTQGVKEMSGHPFEGFGYGRKNYVAGMEAAGRRTIDVSSCNAFLDAWLQLGIQGMLALLFIFFTLAATFIRYANKTVKNERQRSFLVCGFITVVGYFTANQVEGSYVDEMAMTFWLLMGVYIGCSRFQGSQARASYEI